ncbi:MAG: IS200/IS605 family transposase [Deltaproteobacteria bacterium]|jgi:putative transposase|nr:IS200/IS605 family transposase [Deltaproteobacteria bacterium]
MSEQEFNSEAVFLIKLHIVLVTKNRQNLFRGDIKVKLRDIIRNICLDQKVEILEGNISSDHVHLLVSIVPKVNINKFILLLKGKTTYDLFSSFESLRQRYHNRHLWTKGCFCCSCGEVTEDILREYVESQAPSEPSPGQAPW